MRGAVLGQLWLSRCGRFIPACAGNGAKGGRWPSGRPVHPRVCGERRRRWSASLQFTGSSPRVRGTEPARAGRAPLARFIPACAGNGRERLIRAVLSPVHPRVCGERAIERTRPATKCGSSPRVRGTAAAARHQTVRDRFIPACAGNGPASRRSSRPRPVHPRVCGERERGTQLYNPTGGSSPRVRGTGVHA